MCRAPGPRGGLHQRRRLLLVALAAARAVHDDVDPLERGVDALAGIEVADHVLDAVLGRAAWAEHPHARARPHTAGRRRSCPSVPVPPVTRMFIDVLLGPIRSHRRSQRRSYGHDRSRRRGCDRCMTPTGWRSASRRTAAADGRRQPDARVGERGRRRRAGGLAAAEPDRRRRDREPRGWLTTVVSRVCLNVLQSRRAHAGGAARAPAPEPRRRPGRPGARGAARRLDRPCAAGRARHALPGRAASRSCCTTCSRVPFEEIAPIVGRNAAGARQLASRARRRVQAPGRGRANRTWSVRRGSSTRSSPPPAAATSPGCWRCSTPTSCSTPTPPPWSSARRPRPAAPTPSAGSHAVRAGPRRRSSTARRSRSGSPGGEPRVVLLFRVGGDKITEIDVIADPARLSRLDFQQP